MRSDFANLWDFERAMGHMNYDYSVYRRFAIPVLVVPCPKLALSFRGSLLNVKEMGVRCND